MFYSEKEKFINYYKYGMYFDNCMKKRASHIEQKVLGSGSVSGKSKYSGLVLDGNVYPADP